MTPSVSGEALYKLAITNKNTALRRQGNRPEASGFSNERATNIRPGATILFAVPGKTGVKLDVFDARGLWITSVR